jgi:hypothetical protein
LGYENKRGQGGTSEPWYQWGVSKRKENYGEVNIMWLARQCVDAKRTCEQLNEKQIASLLLVIARM